MSLEKSLWTNSPDTAHPHARMCLHFVCWCRIKWDCRASPSRSQTLAYCQSHPDALLCFCRACFGSAVVPPFLDPVVCAALFSRDFLITFAVQRLTLLRYLQKGLFGRRVPSLFDKLSDYRFQQDSTQTGVDAIKNIGVKEFLSYFVPEETSATNLASRKSCNGFQFWIVMCLLLLLLLLLLLSLTHSLSLSKDGA